MEVDLPSVLIKANVFEDRAEFNCVVDLGLLLWTKANALSIAAAFDVEHSLISPDVLVVTDEFSITHSAECCFSSA